jgi:hypothetical protein
MLTLISEGNNPPIYGNPLGSRLLGLGKKEGNTCPGKDTIKYS